MLTMGKRELGQCITDLAVRHVMSEMDDTANRRMGDRAKRRVSDGVMSLLTELIAY